MKLNYESIVSAIFLLYSVINYYKHTGKSEGVALLYEGVVLFLFLNPGIHLQS